MGKLIVFGVVVVVVLIVAVMMSQSSTSAGSSGSASGSAASADPRYTPFQAGKGFWGTGQITEFRTSDSGACRKACLDAPSCTGLTYNPDKQNCWIRSGPGKIVDALPSDYGWIKSS